MAFMILKTNVSKVKSSLFLFFVYLLPSIIIFRSHMELILSRDSAGVQNLMFLKNSL